MQLLCKWLCTLTLLAYKVKTLIMNWGKYNFISLVMAWQNFEQHPKLTANRHANQCC